jgi:hypothetical protein
MADQQGVEPVDPVERRAEGDRGGPYLPGAVGTAQSCRNDWRGAVGPAPQARRWPPRGGSTAQTAPGAARLLEEAADRARHAATAARCRADDHHADRLNRIARELDGEVAYTRNVDLGLPIIRRRSDAPDGATIGWHFAHDPIVRAERERLGLDLYDLAPGRAA